MKILKTYREWDIDPAVFDFEMLKIKELKRKSEEKYELYVNQDITKRRANEYKILNRLVAKGYVEKLCYEGNVRYRLKDEYVSLS